MFARNMSYVHKFEYLFSLLDQGPIFNELIIFHLIFYPDLGHNELRVGEDFHFLDSKVFG